MNALLCKPIFTAISTTYRLDANIHAAFQGCHPRIAIPWGSQAYAILPDPFPCC